MHTLAPAFRVVFVARTLGALSLLGVGLVTTLAVSGNLREALAMTGLTVTQYGVRQLLVLGRLPVSYAAHLVAGSFTLVAAGLAAFNGGGIEAPVLAALPCVPLFVAFLSGWRAAASWSAAGIGVLVVLALLDPWIPAASFEGWTAGVMRAIALIGSIITVLATAWAYDRAVADQQAALTDARALAESASRAKSAFLAAMSHEIRTPLGGIVGLAEVIEGNPDASETPERLRLIRSSSLALLALVDDILDFSRIEAGGVRLEAVPFQAREVARDVVGLLRGRAQAGVELRTSFQGPTEVIGDPLRVRQILLNLVGNALKFTEAGHVTVSVQGRRVGRNVALRLEVVDTGIGISPRSLADLFQAFVQAEQGTARRYGGSGLGLSISQRLAQAMGAEIQVESEPGRGSRFWLDLHLPVAPAVSVVPDDEFPNNLGFRVLVVDDNAINRRVVLAMLARLGCVGSEADGGEAALAAVDRGHLDLILMDLQMPGIDGLEATRRLRAAGISLPILALTANVTPEDREACLQAGMDNFLAKPMPIAKLYAALVKTLGRPVDRAGPYFL